ncbi:MAG: MotA/TolQ/ExbB proton channel family protein, partial [candidate division KSB1 bacterium]|nr:MotA/TolQ/ExbB proton channel family protein [candidate division KSB1 bacterium]
GLLGTVTGITQVFQTITNSAAAKLEMSGVIQQLAKGIYEALWTTILGLSVGIVMMFAYHKYKTNLEALLNKWASMIIHITEKL